MQPTMTQNWYPTWWPIKQCVCMCICVWMYDSLDFIDYFLESLLHINQRPNTQSCAVVFNDKNGKTP